MRRIIILSLLLMILGHAAAQNDIRQQYLPIGKAFGCENGNNRFTRTLYGHGNYEVITSDRPVFLIGTKSARKMVRLQLNGVNLEQTDYCQSLYEHGMQSYLLRDKRWTFLTSGYVRVKVLPLGNEEGAIWQFSIDNGGDKVKVKAFISEADDDAKTTEAMGSAIENYGHLVIKGSKVVGMSDLDAFELFNKCMTERQKTSERMSIDTPDPYINTLGDALLYAADGCQGQSTGRWAPMLGDLLGWNDRHTALISGSAQMNEVSAALTHFLYETNTESMNRQWSAVEESLRRQKATYDPDGDHLYAADPCLLPSPGLKYGSGATTWASAFNYHVNMLAARIAERLGKNASPYRQEAEAIVNALNGQMWMDDEGHWAEYRDLTGRKRRHDNAALWSLSLPIITGACSADQAFKATCFADDHLERVTIGKTGLHTLKNCNWQPATADIGVASPTEAQLMALAYFRAGRPEDGYRLLKATLMHHMYYSSRPANFAQRGYYSSTSEGSDDNADCITATAMALLQGLYGILPDALSGRCIIQPGFPAQWGWAQVKTPYIYYKYVREGGTDRLEITQNFSKPMKIVVRQNLGNGQYRDIEGSDQSYQVISMKSVDLPKAASVPKPSITRTTTVTTVKTWVNGQLVETETDHQIEGAPAIAEQTSQWGKDLPALQLPFKKQNIDRYVNHKTDLSGMGLPAKGSEVTVNGIPFRLPSKGNNIAATSLTGSYPEALTMPLKGKATRASLLLAGTTNHMQSHIDNGSILIRYKGGSTTSLPIRNPENWLPQSSEETASEKPFYVVLQVPLNAQKDLKDITVRTLSNDVEIGLIAVTLQ